MKKTLDSINKKISELYELIESSFSPICVVVSEYDSPTEVKLFYSDKKAKACFIKTALSIGMDKNDKEIALSYGSYVGGTQSVSLIEPDVME